MENSSLPKSSSNTILTQLPDMGYPQKHMHVPMTTLFSSNTTGPHVISQSFQTSSLATNYEGLLYPNYVQNHQSGASYPLIEYGDFSVEGVSSLDTLWVRKGRLLNAWTTKVARSKRKMARQRSLSFSRLNNSASSSSSSSSSSSAHQGDANGIVLSSVATDHAPNNNSTNSKRSNNLYNFCTPDNKRLRVLLKKELKNSDIGSLGRIVLPKREAEENLPDLYDKEGILVVIREVYSNQDWILKYKYWCNNKSRMYVLENTGEFVQKNRLEIGDSITLYEDECKNLYVSIRKAEKANQDELKYQQINYRSCTKTNNIATDLQYASFNTKAIFFKEAKDAEEEASLAILRHDKVQPQANKINAFEERTLSKYSSKIGVEVVDEASLHIKSKMKDEDLLDDFYGDLGNLPEVHSYYYNYTTIFDYMH